MCAFYNVSIAGLWKDFYCSSDTKAKRIASRYVSINYPKYKQNILENYPASLSAMILETDCAVEVRRSHVDSAGIISLARPVIASWHIEANHCFR